MKVSFDFDHTLTNPKYQELAKKFIDLGTDVYITTSRKANSNNVKLPYDNREVFAMAQKLGIKSLNVRFTETQLKYSFLKDFDMHFDDDEEEIFTINEHPGKCLGILIAE